MNTVSEKQLSYSMAGAEQALNISHATLYDLIKQKEIKTFTIGRRRYISCAAMHDFISTKEQVKEVV